MPMSSESFNFLFEYQNNTFCLPLKIFFSYEEKQNCIIENDSFKENKLSQYFSKVKNSHCNQYGILFQNRKLANFLSKLFDGEIKHNSSCNHRNNKSPPHLKLDYNDINISYSNSPNNHNHLTMKYSESDHKHSPCLMNDGKKRNFPINSATIDTDNNQSIIWFNESLLFPAELLYHVVLYLFGIPLDSQRLMLNGKDLSFCSSFTIPSVIDSCKTPLNIDETSCSLESLNGTSDTCRFTLVKILHRLRGGKGGFGAMLRGQKGKKKKTTNFDSCRDLSGRRIRNAKAMSRLNAWLEKKKMERNLVKALTGDVRTENLSRRTNDDLNVVDGKLISKMKQTSNRMDPLLKQGLKRNTIREARATEKRRETDNLLKNLQELYCPDSEDTCDSDDEQNADTKDSFNRKEDKSSTSFNNLLKGNFVSSDHSDENSRSDDPRSCNESLVVTVDAETFGLKDTIIVRENVKTEIPYSMKSHKQIDMCSAPNQELGSNSSTVSPGYTNDELVGKSPLGKITAEELDNIQEDLKNFKSAEEIISGVEDEIMKGYLQKMNMKSGGTTLERARRLLIVRNLGLSNIPKRLLAKRNS